MKEKKELDNEKALEIAKEASAYMNNIKALLDSGVTDLNEAVESGNADKAIRGFAMIGIFKLAFDRMEKHYAALADLI